MESPFGRMYYRRFVTYACDDFATGFRKVEMALVPEAVSLRGMGDRLMVYFHTGNE